MCLAFSNAALALMLFVLFIVFELCLFNRQFYKIEKCPLLFSDLRD